MSFIPQRDGEITIPEEEWTELEEMYFKADAQFIRDYVDEEYAPGYPIEEVPILSLPSLSWNSFYYGYLVGKGLL